MIRKQLPTLTPRTGRGKYIRPDVKIYTTVEDFMDERELNNFNRYLQSNQKSDTAGDNPNDDKQRQQPERLSKNKTTTNNSRRSRQEETERTNRLMQIRNNIDDMFVYQVHGIQPNLLAKGIGYQIDLQREVLIRHAIQHMPEDDSKLLNQSLFRNNRDKNGFMKSSLSVKLSTTIISAWYDKAVEMYDPREPKFISSNDVLLKIQGWKRRTKQQMQQERDSVLRELLRGGSTEQDANTSSESSSQSKESSFSPEPCANLQVGSVNSTEDIKTSQQAAEPEQRKREPTLLELLQSNLSPFLQIPKPASSHQDSNAMAVDPPNSQMPSSSQRNNQNVWQNYHQEEKYSNFGQERLIQNMPSTSQAGQANYSDNSTALAQQQPISYSSKPESIGVWVEPRSDIFGGEKAGISHPPCSYSPNYRQPEIQENYHSPMLDQQVNSVGSGVLDERQHMLYSSKSEYSFDGERASTSHAQSSYIPTFDEPAQQGSLRGQINDQQYFNETSQNTLVAENIKLEPGVVLEDVKQEPTEFNNSVCYPSLTNKKLAEPLPEQRRNGSNLQNSDSREKTEDMDDAPYNQIYNGVGEIDVSAFCQQNQQHNDPRVSMSPNNMSDAGSSVFDQHQPNMVPQFIVPPGSTQQPQLLPPQQNQPPFPRGERKLPEAMTLVLPNSQKTDCNDWTEEDCRSWIENLAFENKEDLEYLRGQRFTKFDFMFLVQNQDSRESVFNMPRPVYSALLCSFNKVLNMHNGHH
ncbi:unnamed protein product [Caenorhabditis brenneri]